MEELKAAFRLLNEQRRRVQAEKEKCLQQAIKTYEKDRENGQKDIANKKLALQKSEAKCNEDRNALRDAVQHAATRKREHEAEVEQLNQDISAVKRMKPSSEGLPVRLVFSSVKAPFTSSTIITRTFALILTSLLP